MNCTRCGHPVPDFLWLQEEGKTPDHPVLVDDKPIIVNRTENNETNIVLVRATVYTQRKLCSEVFPDQVRIFNWTEETELETAISESIGAASACWETLEGAGIFESDRAKQINDELIAFIRAKYENDVKGDNTDKVRCRNCGNLVNTPFEHAELRYGAHSLKWKC